jgi:hypothetical protein
VLAITNATRWAYTHALVYEHQSRANAREHAVMAALMANASQSLAQKMADDAIAYFDAHPHLLQPPSLLPAPATLTTPPPLPAAAAAAAAAWFKLTLRPSSASLDPTDVVLRITRKPDDSRIFPTKKAAAPAFLAVLRDASLAHFFEGMLIPADTMIASRLVQLSDWKDAVAIPSDHDGHGEWDVVMPGYAFARVASRASRQEDEDRRIKDRARKLRAAAAASAPAPTEEELQTEDDEDIPIRPPPPARADSVDDEDVPLVR